MADETNSQRIARQRREAGGVNGARTDGASKVQGYSRFRQGPAARNFSNLDAFYANQRGAPSSDNPAFAGLTPEEVAMEMKRRGETTGPGGNAIVPDTRMPPRPRPVGAGQDTPLPADGAPVKDDPFGTGFEPMGNNNPFAPPPAPAAVRPVQPVDPSTVRQPVGMLDPEDTPAMRRQMAADAAMGRAVSTAGTTGLTPSATGGRPMQSADYRRMISSKYGTGTNVAREPGQGPATTTDLMGRPAQLRQMLRDREEIQRTKGMA
jgi:hypothetical protein